MIAGRVVDIVLHDGKAYKPVARKAQVGELIQIVKEEWTGGHHKNGDIMIITDYTKPDFPFIYHFSYVTLEPIPRMSDEPHPEIAEGSTFVTCDENERQDYKAGQIVTLTDNDDTDKPYFDERSPTKRKCISWYKLAPVNIIYKQEAKDRIIVDELKELKECDTCQFEENLTCNWPCACCSEFSNYKPKTPKSVCPACGQPVKRTYTPEQIAEARDIVYRILTTRPDRAYRFRAYPDDSRRIYATEYQIAHGDVVGENNNYSVCPVTEEWQDDIMRLRALLKLTGGEMPKWLQN